MNNLDAYIDAMSDALALPIAPGHRPGVRTYLQLVSGIATRVTDFPLTPADDAATVFVPVEPAP
jgi:hypothetical protein